LVVSHSVTVDGEAVERALTPVAISSMADRCAKVAPIAAAHDVAQIDEAVDRLLDRSVAQIGE
jgi:hypothetical protein